MAELKPKITLSTKGEEAFVTIKQMVVTLRWRAAVDLDLMAFYKTKDGRVGGVFSSNYQGGTMGSLNAFPFIQLSGDAGVGAAGGDNEEVLRIAKFDDMAEVYICAINFTDAVANSEKAFSNYDAEVIVQDDTGEAVAVPLNSTQAGTVAVIAKMEDGGMMGSKLVNVNQVVNMRTFKAEFPGADKLELSSKIVLNKKGDSAAIAVTELHATLAWTAAVDLDLHVYYRTKVSVEAAEQHQKKGRMGRMFSTDKGESKDGHVYFLRRGDKEKFPWIYLDQDAGVGDKGGKNIENIYFTNLDRIEHILIVANIFNKPNANFASYDGIVTVFAGGQTIEVPLTESTPGSHCIIAHLDNSGAGSKLVNVNRVQKKEPSLVDFVGSR